MLDPFDVLLRKVQREVQLRQATQLQTLDELAPNEARRMLQRLDGVRLFFAAAQHADEHARVPHVRLHAHFADHHRAFQPRVLQLPGQHGIDFVRNFLAHTFMTVICRTHRKPLNHFHDVIHQDRTQQPVRFP